MTTRERGGAVAPALYWAWIESEAALIRSDGCTKATGWKLPCCHEHDLAFWHGKDPRAAYQRWLVHHHRDAAWHEAAPISFEAANRDFRTCHSQRSPLGWWWWLDPRAVVRWRAVVRLSRAAWDAHRARELATGGQR